MQEINIEDCYKIFYDLFDDEEEEDFSYNEF